MDNQKTTTLPIKGEYDSSFSISPLKEAEGMLKRMETYLEGKRKEHNASVFRIHAGLKTVVCLDHVSAEFYFNAPRDFLEREAQPRFGPLSIRPELLKGACPALVASGTTHDQVRKLTDDILKLRANELPIAFEKVTERLFEKWEKMGTVPLLDVLLEWSSNITCNWILGVDIPMERMKIWIKNILTINTDTLLTQMLGKLIFYLNVQGKLCKHSKKWMRS